MSTELKNRASQPTIPGKLYLHLYHGRKAPSSDLENWGEDGPWIGPLKGTHITYLSTIGLVFEDGYETGPCSIKSDEFGFHEDLLFFDSMYYGDFDITIAE